MRRVGGRVVVHARPGEQFQWAEVEVEVEVEAEDKAKPAEKERRVARAHIHGRVGRTVLRPRGKNAGEKANDAMSVKGVKSADRVKYVREENERER